MKIKTKEKSYTEVMALPREKHQKPMRQLKAFRTLLKLVSFFDLRATQFSCEKIGMEKLGQKEPCLILMNHSSFIDLEIASNLLSDREYHIVCTLDGFVGKKLLMRLLGCISAKKFINDIQLVKDMRYTVNQLKASILMYPEASYSFDGTQTPLPESLGKCIKLLKVPVIMIRTQGAFLRDPLYNGLQCRKVKVSAKMEYILSGDEIAEKSVAEINHILQKAFSFDNFKEQQEQGILVKDIAASFSNFFGGRSGSYEEELITARQNALAEMEQRASALGANAVVGVDIDYEVLGADNGMLMVTASGTAVYVE